MSHATTATASACHYYVIYEGEAPDPEAFYRYYVDHHVAIVQTFPKIRGIQVDRGVEGGDFVLIARFSFDSPGDLKEALSSPERLRAKKDMAAFPSFEGRVRRQVTIGDRFQSP